MSEIVKLLKTKDKIRELSPAETQAGGNVMRTCFELKPGEKVLVVTDSGKLKEAAVFFEAAKKFSKNVELVEMLPRKESGEEPPTEVVEAMRQADVACLVTTHSLTHTNASGEAKKAGARVASMPGITLEMITRTLVLDYGEIASLTKDIAAALTAGETARIRSAMGTNITLSLAGRDGIADTGLLTNPGDLGNLPAGEAFIAPKEGTANGVAVFDGCFAGVCLDEPIRVTIENGAAVKIEGGKGAKELEDALEAIGGEACPSKPWRSGGRNVAELGVGTNKAARPSKEGDNLLEVEKLYGTVHLAFGNNAHFGGEVDVPFHRDGVILNPTLEIDSKIILANGEFNL